MTRVINLFVALTLVSIGCSNKQRTLIIDKETKAVGNISKDTVYEGLINFYNLQSGKLITASNYLSGKLNGESIEYNANGLILSKVSYENGKQNGIASVFDRNGKRINNYFTYYGLKVGEDVLFRDERLSVYDFYSFDNKKLLSVNYDSIGTKSITDVQQGFFFYTKRNFLVTNSISNTKHAELFLYTPNPPNYDFKYSLVLIDDKYNVKSEIKMISTVDRWSVFEINQPNMPDSKLALRLVINDPNVAKSIVMFKILE
jgi:hypothetical protein